MVLLADQDRSLWNRDMIDEGQVVRALLRRNTPGPYQIQAAINAVHSDAPSAALTDWSQIVQLYDLLLDHTPTPIVALNRAVARSPRSTGLGQRSSRSTRSRCSSTTSSTTRGGAADAPRSNRGRRGCVRGRCS